MKVMLDTNIFNRLVEGKFDLAQLPPDAEIFVTHVQRDELNATPDEFRQKREKLLEHFAGIVQEGIPTESSALGESKLGKSKLGGKSIPTETMIWNMSNWDEAKWGGGSPNSLYHLILSRLESRDKNPKKKNSHIRDALISETAIANNITLVSADRTLVKVLKELGFPVIPIS